MQRDEQAAARQRTYEPEAVARVLLSTGETLIELLDAETELLRASRTAEIAALGSEKGQLSQVFSAGWRQFQTDPEQVDRLAPELQHRLRDIALRLNRAASENEAMLRIGRRAAELVLAAVARALEAQRPRPTYTAARMARPPGRDQAGISVNRSA